MKDQQPPLWEILKEQEVYSAPPWMSVRRQHVRLPNGKTVENYHQIVLRDYAIIIAQTTDGKYIAERQYKHGVGRVSLTLPGGVIEDGEPPELAAKRELLEETGYEANDWRNLGSYVSNGNYGCGHAHIFTARNARRVAEPNSGDLEEMEIVLLSAAELVQAIHNGEVPIIGAVAAILWALNPASTDRG